MVEVRLSDRRNYAIAVFASGENFSVVVGNVPEDEINTAYETLRDEALDYFGEVVDVRSGPGSKPDRFDATLVVGGSKERVMDFVKERLGGGPNQMN